jgi:uncharacterized membrane protein
MKGKAICSICIIFILLFSFCQIIPVNVSAVGEPVVDLRWYEDQEVQYADVRPGESGLVLFPATVSADIPFGSSVQNVMVELRASSEHGWGATVMPAVINVDPGTEVIPFSVTVEVPTGTSATTQATVIVDGTATTYPGNTQSEIDPLYGTILINPYSRFTVGSNSPYLETTPDSEVEFEVFIQNEGNAIDRFEISIINLDDLADDDFEVSVDPETIEIPEKGKGTITVTVKAPEASLGESVNYRKDIEIQFISKLDPDMKGNYYQLNVRVKNSSVLESENLFTYIIVIIVAVICIIFLWRYRKKKKK